MGDRRKRQDAERQRKRLVGVPVGCRTPSLGVLGPQKMVVKGASLLEALSVLAVGVSAAFFVSF